MKINFFEKLCKDFGGNYEYSITDDNRYLFVTWRTCRHALFPDDFNIIKRKAMRKGFKLQYISYKSDGIGLEFIYA